MALARLWRTYSLGGADDIRHACRMMWRLYSGVYYIRLMRIMSRERFSRGRLPPFYRRCHAQHVKRLTDALCVAVQNLVGAVLRPALLCTGILQHSLLEPSVRPVMR